MYIVAIMITAVIFSITGMGVLNLALLVNLDTQTAVQSLSDKIDAESAVNIALWRLNSADDSLATYTDGDVTSIFDSTALTLTVSLAGTKDTTGFIISLEADNHFNHAITTHYSISIGSYTVGEERDHALREYFDFLPIIDTAYWNSVADTIFADNSRLYHDGDLIEGILLFTGSSPKFDGISLNNTTMVFTAPGIVDFRHTNVIKAAYTDSTIFPALVFTDSSSIFVINDGAQDTDTIQGAIFSYGSITLEKGEISGPVIARGVTVNANMDFLDDQYPQYYAWPEGFSHFDNYDWPKQIVQWKEL